MRAVPRTPRRTVTDADLKAWMALPGHLKSAVHGLPEVRLDGRAGPESMSVRETVHHLVEANVIASNILLSALARSGSPYDWTWVWPGGEWMQRVGYGTAPVRPAIDLLAALTRHFAALLTQSADAMDRTVVLYDTADGPRYTKTVRQLLRDEVAHAREHLSALPPRRRRDGPAGPKASPA